MGREMTDDSITGEWISGTLKPDSLIPIFVAAAVRALEWQSEKGKILSAELEKTTHEVNRISSISGTESYYASEAASLDLEVLDRILNDLAPDGYWWGAHEGDGASFGFWEHSAEATS
jgi:hypothetical protein